MKTIIIPCIAAIGITSCSSGLPSNKTTEFKTRITESGLKHFQVQLVSALPQKHPQSPQNITKPPRSGKNPDKKAITNEKLLINQANSALALNGYCQKGYWILDKNLYGPTPWIRGECNDAASSTDRQQFPDTLKNW